MKKSMFVLFFLFSLSSLSFAANFNVSTAIEFQDALDVAAENAEDDLIKLAQGFYTGNFVYAAYEENSLSIKGGYNSDFTVQTLDPENTVLDGGGVDRILSLVVNDKYDLEADFSIDGLTFQNGARSDSILLRSRGNIQIKYNVIKSQNCISVQSKTANISNNNFIDSSINCYSSIRLELINNIYEDATIHQNSFSLESKEIYIVNNVIQNNKEGGISVNRFYGDNGDNYVYVYGNIIQNNNIIGYGVIDIFYSTSYVEDNVFQNNSVYTTYCSFFPSGSVCSHVGYGGIYFYGYSSRAYIQNNVFYNNHPIEPEDKRRASYIFSAFGFYGQFIQMVNNTFYDNSSISTSTKHIIKINSQESHIYNNTFYKNDGGIYIDNLDKSVPYFPIIYPVDLFNNNFDQSENGFYAESPIDIDPSNLDNVDPLFVDPANGDFRLSVLSPCINAGSNGVPGLQETDTDIAGNPRIMDEIIDMGAYEANPDNPLDPVPQPTSKAVYRFYAPNLQAHFWTIDQDEAEYIKGNYSGVWSYEGIGWYAFDKDDNPPKDSKPVYRFWMEGLGEHFYTMDEAEKDYIIANYPASFQRYEGIAYYAYPEETKPSNAVPVYRFWLPFLGSHHFTIDPAEKASIIASYPTAVYEGIAWYVLEH